MDDLEVPPWIGNLHVAADRVQKHEDRNAFEARPAISKLVREGLNLSLSASCGSEKPGTKFNPCNIHGTYCFKMTKVTPQIYGMVDLQRSHCHWPLGSRSLVGQHAPILRGGVDCDHASMAQGPSRSIRHIHCSAYVCPQADIII